MQGQNYGPAGAVFGNQQQQQIHGMIQEHMNSQPMQQPMSEIQNNVQYVQ